MNIDEHHHVALPKLYGAPAYARPPRVFDESDRPPDPDDLPLEVYRGEDWTTAPTTEASELLGDLEMSRASGSVPVAAGVVEPVAVVAAEPVAAEPAGEPDAAEAETAAESTLRPRPFSVRTLRGILRRH